MSGGQINDPQSGNRCSLLFLPATPPCLPRTLEGLFELPHCPWTLDSPHALLPELRRYKETVRCAGLGTEVPGDRQKQLTQTLIVRLLKTHFSHRSSVLKSQQNIVEFVTRPGGKRGHDKAAYLLEKYAMNMIHVLKLEFLQPSRNL